MSIWQKIKNFFVDTDSIKNEFQAMLEAEEKAAVSNQITDAVTQAAPEKKKPVKKTAAKAPARKTTSKKKK